MAYRNSVDLPRDVLAASQLRDKAALGRLRRDAAAARRARADARRKAAERRRSERRREAMTRVQARRRGMSMVRGSWLTSPMTLAWAVSTAVGIAPIALLLGGGVVAWSFVALAALPLLLVLPRHALASRRLRAEAAWEEQHGFAIDGHWLALGTATHHRRAVIEFAGSSPARELVADLVAASNIGELLDEDDEIAIALPGSSALWDYNHSYRRALHRLIDEVVAPLDAVYRVACVRVI